MTQLVITVGLPASGKSTWAKSWVGKDPLERLRINRDDLRSMLTVGEYNKFVDTYIKNLQYQIIEKMLTDGISVVVDNTHLKIEDISRLFEIADQFKDVEVIIQKFDTPVEECIKRNNERTIGHVPTETIENMAKSKLLTMSVKDIIKEAEHATLH